MNRISKWIQERKAYSNPVFGAMLILSGMIFPVFYAAAEIEQPVQPMAQTADQVVDALNAVQIGATTEQAFLAQPLPYQRIFEFSEFFVFGTFSTRDAVGRRCFSYKRRDRSKH